MNSGSFADILWNDRTAHQVLIPGKAQIAAFSDRILNVLFPHFSGDSFRSREDVDEELRALQIDLIAILTPLAGNIKQPIVQIADVFPEELSSIYDALRLDAAAIMAGDPAAETIDEVIAAYPGFLAIALYRIAHSFYRHGIPIFPRLITEYAHQQTGIDIHPGATIGKSFCIDHGTGIVVGETSLIGDNVKLYQGVTLGALSVAKNFGGTKRHPTIGDNVVIYSNATILGGNTVIGHDSTIGGNVWLTESVDPYSVVYHKSEINVRSTRTVDEPINFSI